MDVASSYHDDDGAAGARLRTLIRCPVSCLISTVALSERLLMALFVISS